MMSLLKWESFFYNCINALLKVKLSLSKKWHLRCEAVLVTIDVVDDKIIGNK